MKSQKDPLKTIFALVGPTCTNKTGLGIELAKKNPFEIISADSRLVYKEMDIGTSKPSKIEMRNVPHYMIDIVKPSDSYTVGLYKKESEKIIDDIFSRNKIPFFVGGTGLYLNSVLSGLSIPEVQPDLSLREQLKQYSQEELYKRLKELDLKASETIHENDNFRTVRALEVIYKTNKLFSELKEVRDLPFKVVWIGMTYKDREAHTEKIRFRTERFCREGFIEEVKTLLLKYGELDLFKRTIGYAETLEFLKGTLEESQLIETITFNTRRLLKRQMTWFRANKSIKWVYLDDLEIDKQFNQVSNIIDESLSGSLS